MQLLAVHQPCLLDEQEEDLAADLEAQLVEAVAEGLGEAAEQLDVRVQRVGVVVALGQDSGLLLKLGLLRLQVVDERDGAGRVHAHAHGLVEVVDLPLGLGDLPGDGARVLAIAAAALLDALGHQALQRGQGGRVAELLADEVEHGALGPGLG